MTSLFDGSGDGRVVTLLACGARGPGFDSLPRHLDFQRLVISCFQVAIWLKYRYSDVILYTTNQPLFDRRFRFVDNRVVGDNLLETSLRILIKTHGVRVGEKVDFIKVRSFCYVPSPLGSQKVTVAEWVVLKCVSYAHFIINSTERSWLWARYFQKSLRDHYHPG